jgi:hypothetical protein
VIKLTVAFRSFVNARKIATFASLKSLYLCISGLLEIAHKRMFIFVVTAVEISNLLSLKCLSNLNSQVFGSSYTAQPRT